MDLVSFSFFFNGKPILGWERREGSHLTTLFEVQKQTEGLENWKDASYVGVVMKER